MFKAIFESIITILYVGFFFYSAQSLYNYFQTETVKGIHKGLRPLSKFTKSLTKKEYDWEKVPGKQVNTEK